ncbi:unnamed protein product [Cylicocyclus nassatus]|uniref:TFIIS N-terminal domain-containing protein n=1 Tax=Cylicocyclus nassatus TaxID=53992 RepID=A0AA36HG11_CYLNA|nr:unnamed protein product [Cylicocyclus nassatus]
MTVDDAVLNKVLKYGKLIKKKEKVSHALARLNNIDMTLEILSATNIGRYVNRLCHDAEYGRDASKIIEKWKEIARQSGVRGGDEDRNSEDDHPQQNGSSDSIESDEHGSYLMKSDDAHQDSEQYNHEDAYKGEDSDEDSHSRRYKREEKSRDHYEDTETSGQRQYCDDRRSNHSHDDADSDSAYHDYEDNHDQRRTNDYDSDGAGQTLDRPCSSRASDAKDSRKRHHNAEERTSSKQLSNETKKVKASKVVTEFDMILQSADTGHPKHKKVRDAHIKWTEMPVLTNYQPFPQAVRVAKDANTSPADDFNPENMFKPRNERGKVFAGRRKSTPLIVPSLFNICLRVLSNNIGVLLYAEYIPYDVLKPVLEKCTDEELASIETKHPYIEDDSGELWQRLVSKKYPGEEPDTDGSWKELYYYLEKEKEEKLKRLSQRIGKMHQADSAKGQRKTLLADATAPLSVRRRQMQHGIAHVSRPLPSAIEVSSARRKIFETGGSKAALSTLPSAVVNRNSTVGAKTDRHAKKPPAKKGALMIKTMKMLNMKRK